MSELSRPDLGHECLRETCADDDAGGKGEESEPGLERRIAEHSLQVEGIEEEHREEARCDEEHRDVRGADGADAEDAEPDQRLDRAALDHHEGCEQRDRDPADAELCSDPQPFSCALTIA